MVGVKGFEPSTPLHPMQVRYQAAPHADKPVIIGRKSRLQRKKRTNFQQLFLYGIPAGQSPRQRHDRR